MEIALQHAKKAFEVNEVPVSCIFVKDPSEPTTSDSPEVLCSAHNLTNTTNNVTK